MPRRGREGRRRHIGGGPGVGPGGRVRRSRSTSITLVVVVARILGRVERDWPRRAEFVGTRAGGETAESHIVATASPKLYMYPEAAEPSAYSQPIVVFVRRSANFAHRVLARSSSLFAVGRREGRVVLQKRYFRSTTPSGAKSRRLELRARRFTGIAACRGALREPSCRAPGLRRAHASATSFVGRRAGFRLTKRPTSEIGLGNAAVDLPVRIPVSYCN